MISLNFRLSGQDTVAAKIERGTTITTALEPAMKKSVLYVLSTVPGYPPASTESRYRRTDTLGRSVTSMSAVGALSRVEPMGGGFAGIIGTALDYASYVIDESNQAWMHRGRWWTLQQTVRNAIPGVVRILRDAVNRHIGD